MPVAARKIDPLRNYREGVRARNGGVETPIPLAATNIDVAIRGLFATVTTKRLFRNEESVSIEATLTYPIPVDAIAHGLKVAIDGRKLVGVAEPRQKARETYEGAIDAGKTAILHEEKLKGVHVISVGHIPPGKEVEVEVSWSKPLAFLGDTPSLRVPNTVAEIYGRSPLLPVDDLTADASLVFEADVAVSLDSGVAHIQGHGSPDAGAKTRITLDRPLVISVTGSKSAPLEGLSAGGRKVTMTIKKCAVGERPLKAALLHDRSGSTGGPLDGGGAQNITSTWSSSTSALKIVAKDLRKEDWIDLWEFDSTPRHLGSAPGNRLGELLRKLGGPQGGTEIGLAIGAVIEKNREADDIVVITDGRSHALDPESFAACGRRISAVLCGTNSLDAAIGHLVALTGGQIVVASSGNIVEAIGTVLNSLRLPGSPASAKDATALPAHLCELRAGAEISISWSGEAENTAGPADAVGIYAAGIALPLLTEAAATETAVAHGIACHLTSLVVVDDAGGMQEGIPETRKVPLSVPYESSRSAPEMRRRAAAAGAASELLSLERRAPIPPAPRAEAGAPAGMFGTLRALVSRFSEDRRELRPARRADALRSVAKGIDWDKAANELLRGRLSKISDEARASILIAAGSAEIEALAREARRSEIEIVIGLLARSAGAMNRAAERVARRLLKGLAEVDLDAAAKAIGL